MASGGDDTVDVALDVTVNLADLDAALKNAVTAMSVAMGKEFDKIIRNLASGVRKAASAGQFDLGSKQAQAAVNDLIRSLGKAESATLGLKESFGEAFDGRVFEGFDDQLRRLIILQQKLDEGFGNPEAIKQEIKAITSGLVSTRNLAREATATARQDARVKMQDLKSYTSRYVVDAQTQSAAARNASKEAVEATRAASRRRVVIIQAAARTIATIERNLSTVFKGTANAIGSAFRGIGTAAGGAATGIGNAFKKANTQIINNTASSASSISNSYSTSMRRATNSVRNETNNQTSIIKNFAREANSSLGNIGSGAGFGIGAAIGGILGVGAARALRGGFERATTIETAEVALTKLLGTAEKAKALLTEVTEVVTGTPFALDQFAAATSQLLAYNIEAEKIPDILRAAGDAAALSGPNAAQAIDSILRSIGQIKTVGRASLEEIKVIAEAGVPAFKILGNAFDVTTEQLRDMFEKGLIPADRAIDALVKGITEGTDGVNGATAAFGGLAKELGGTLAGSVANFNTSIKRLGANVITAFKGPFTLALGAATAAVDLLGSALKTLAVAIQDTPTFALIQRGLASLTETFKTAKDELAGFFTFISGGLVVLGQAALVFAAFKRIPAALRLIGGAIKFILAPQRLLIAGVILVASYFKKLYDESITLREALGKLFVPLKRIGTVIVDLVQDAFKALTGGAKDAGEGVGGFAEKILSVVVPALEKLSTFLLEKVLPPVRRFAKRMREDVIPAIGRFLVNAVKFAQDAFAALVRFVQDEVIPVVGPLLETAIGIGKAAFEGLYNFVSGTFVPFLQKNLIPVLAGVGAALGVFALSGGNIPLAGLAGIGAGLIAVLSNDDIRNALIDNIDKAVTTVKEKLGGLFDGDTLKDIGVGVLKAANKIGQVLGNILSDPRLFATVGIIAGLAAALAASFVVGFVDGLLSNVPELAAGIAKVLNAALLAALKAAASKPALAAAAVLLFGGAAFLRGVSKAGKAAVAEFNRAASVGPGNQFRAQSGSATSFVRGLIGGPDAIAKNVQAQFKAAEKVTIREGQRLQRIALATTGNVVRNNQGQFLKPADAAGIARGYDQMARSVGATNLAAGQLRAGIGQVTDSFRRGVPFLTNFKDGIRSIAEGAGTAVRTFGASAGVALGAAFAASFISQALFDIESSGKEKIQSALGTIATGAAAGAEIGGAKGALVGAGLGGLVTAIGLITTAFRDNASISDEAAEAIERYAAALRDVESIKVPQVIDDTILLLLKEEAPNVQDALNDIGFSYTKFADSVRGDTVAKDFGDIAFFANQSVDALKDFAKERPTPGYNNIVQDLAAVGITGQDAADVLDFLQDQVVAINAATTQFELDQKTEALGETVSATTTRLQLYRDSIRLASGAADVGADATQAYKDKLTELNDQRLDGLRENVRAATDQLGEAKSAADDALQAVKDFLSGGATADNFQTVVDEATVSVVGLGEQLTALQSGAPGFEAEWRLAIGRVKTEAGEVLAKGITDGTVIDAATAATALQPLIAAAGGAGTAGGDAAAAAIAEVIAAFTLPEGTNLLTGAIDAQATIAAAQAELDLQELNLEVGITLPPTLFYNITSQARTAFDAAGAASSAGYVAGFDSEAMKTKAEDGVKDALAAAETALGIDSPSKEYQRLGKDSVDGLVLGMREGFPRAALTAQYLGIATMQGFQMGIESEAVTVGKDIVVAFVEGINGQVEALQTAGKLIMDSLLLGISESGEYLLTLDAGTAAAFAFGDGTARSDVQASLKDRGLQITKTTAAGLSESGEFLDFLDAGRNAGLAFARGLRGSAAIAAAAGRSVARAAVRAVEEALEINSPSKVMADLGRQTMQGFADGLTESTQVVATAASSAIQGALDSAQTGFGGAIDVNVGAAQVEATRYAATADTVPYGGAAMKTMTDADITNLARMIALESKPNVQIDQTFTEPVDSRAIAADVAWRLT